MSHIDPFDKVAHLLSHCHLKHGDPDTVILYRGDYRKAFTDEEIALDDFLAGSFLTDPHKKELWDNCLVKTFKAYLAAKLAGKSPHAFSLSAMNAKKHTAFQREQMSSDYMYL